MTPKTTYRNLTSTSTTPTSNVLFLFSDITSNVTFINKRKYRIYKKQPTIKFRDSPRICVNVGLNSEVYSTIWVLAPCGLLGRPSPYGSKNTLCCLMHKITTIQIQSGKQITEKVRDVTSFSFQNLNLTMGKKSSESVSSSQYFKVSYCVYPTAKRCYTKMLYQQIW
jgi:hypothetical protein